MSADTSRFVVPAEQAGLRLDRFVAASGGWSRSQAARWVADGLVLRNGRAAKPAALLQAGDVVEVSPPEAVPSEVAAQEIPLDVLYEDEHLIVINKPAGLVVHPAAGNPDGTLVNALLAHCRDLSGIGGVERPGIVHRLDKDTSGVLIAAKNDGAHRALSLSFRWRTTEKRYLCVVYGVPARDEGVVDAPIARHPSERKRMAVVPAAGSRARCGGCASASPAPPSSSAARSPVGRTRSASTWRTSATLSSATRCTPASSGAPSPTRSSRRAVAPSRARRCTPGVSPSPTRCPARQ